MDEKKYQQFLDTLESLRTFSENLDNFVKRMQSIYQAFQRISGTIHKLYEIFKPIKDVINQIVEFVAEDPGGFQRFLERFEPNFWDSIYLPIVRQGWVVRMSKLSVGEVIELKKIAETESEVLDGYLISYLNQTNIMSMLRDKWRLNRYFKERKEFLECGLKAHNDGNYMVSISVMLPHIEGILKTFFDVCKRPVNKGGKQCVEMLNRFTFVSEIETYKSYAVKPLGKAYLGIEVPSDIFPNRNGIFHGSDIKYHTEVNSAKLLYMLDFICDITQAEIQGVKGKT